jgi:hypothetical protein
LVGKIYRLLLVLAAGDFGGILVQFLHSQSRVARPSLR